MTKKEFATRINEIHELQAKLDDLTYKFFNDLDEDKLSLVLARAEGISEMRIDVDMIINEFLCFKSDSSFGVKDIDALWNVYQGKYNPIKGTKTK